jgi:hypothetical protein
MEPFPVQVELRGDEYRELIEHDAAVADVLETATRRREDAPTYTFQRKSVL